MASVFGTAGAGLAGNTTNNAVHTQTYINVHALTYTYTHMYTIMFSASKEQNKNY